MSANDQQKDEAEPLEIFTVQFPALANQMVNIVRQFSGIDARWPAWVLIGMGGLLPLVALAMKFFEPRLGILWIGEFIALITAGMALMIAGGIFNMYQARNWRAIIQEQQTVGVEILNKQIDIANQLILKKHRTQEREEVIIFQSRANKPLGIKIARAS
ncbi:MAG TPA: hypothetical protein VF544_08935 [Pyrinomonadaceae bacterium]